MTTISMRDELAKYAHEAWCRSMKHVFDNSLTLSDGTVKIPAKAVARWQKRMGTSYNDLLEEEQGSDLKEVDILIRILWYRG